MAQIGDKLQLDKVINNILQLRLYWNSAPAKIWIFFQIRQNVWTQLYVGEVLFPDMSRFKFLKYNSKLTKNNQKEQNQQSGYS